MTTVRVMFVGHGPSNLPADRVVNVFHFKGTSTYSIDELSCRQAVADFYEGANATNSVGGYLSPWVQRSYELRSYDMDIPKDTRVPTVEARTLGGPFGNGLPEETAVCITLHGAVPPALSRRRTGRVYIGPLTDNAMAAGSTTQPARPSSLLIADFVQAAARLRNLGTGPVVWCIRSTRPSENYVPVAGGFVDNAFDNQLRRGPAPTAKVLWGAVEG